MSKLDKLMSVLIAMFFVGLTVWTFYYYQPEVYHYFFSTDGPKNSYHFQWVGMTAMFAVIGFFGNQYWERRKLRASLKSRGSIEWMETFRGLIADLVVYTTDGFQADLDYLRAQINGADFGLREQYRYESNKYSSLLQRTYNLLQLYVPASGSTEQIIELINKITEESDLIKESISVGKITNTDDLVNKINTHEAKVKIVDDLLDELIVASQKYLRSEWHQASQGK